MVFIRRALYETTIGMWENHKNFEMFQFTPILKLVSQRDVANTSSSKIKINQRNPQQQF